MNHSSYDKAIFLSSISNAPSDACVDAFVHNATCCQGDLEKHSIHHQFD